eukprot:TRINITY_DN5531_c0_g1_i1.p1 TRINITY_DN5531_c0_g1~~TRINITY_DN5531_c0_g1_i1.p1  ORF type:complete len:1776 (+),score=284.31 TRINITY_DN5531_c0_g1_i1:104-5431(+)
MSDSSNDPNASSSTSTHSSSATSTYSTLSATQTATSTQTSLTGTSTWTSLTASATSNTKTSSSATFTRTSLTATATSNTSTSSSTASTSTSTTIFDASELASADERNASDDATARNGTNVTGQDDSAPSEESEDTELEEAVAGETDTTTSSTTASNTTVTGTQTTRTATSSSTLTSSATSATRTSTSTATSTTSTTSLNETAWDRDGNETSTTLSSTSTTSSTVSSTTTLVKELRMMSAELLLSDRMSLRIRFNWPARLADDDAMLSCQAIFENASLSSLGVVPTCRFLADSLGLHVQLGSRAGITHGQLIELKTGSLLPAVSAYVVTPLNGSVTSAFPRRVKTKAMLRAPKEAEFCSLLRFSAVESRGFAGRSPKIRWNFGRRTTRALADLLQGFLSEASVLGLPVLEILPDNLSTAVRIATTPPMVEEINLTESLELRSLGETSERRTAAVLHSSMDGNDTNDTNDSNDIFLNGTNESNESTEFYAEEPELEIDGLQLEVVVTVENWQGETSSDSVIVMLVDNNEDLMPQLIDSSPSGIEIFQTDKVEMSIETSAVVGDCKPAPRKEDKLLVLWEQKRLDPRCDLPPDTALEELVPEEDSPSDATSSTTTTTTTTQPSWCFWQDVRSTPWMNDLNRKPLALGFQAFTFEPDSTYQFRATTFFSTASDASVKPSANFTLQVQPRRRPVAVLDGPSLASEACGFVLNASESHDPSLAPGETVEFEFRWFCRVSSVTEKIEELENATEEPNCGLANFGLRPIHSTRVNASSNLSNQSNLSNLTMTIDDVWNFVPTGASLFVPKGNLRQGIYLFTVEVTRRNETSSEASNASLSVTVRAGSLPSVTLRLPWMGESSMSTMHRSLNATAVLRGDSDCPLVEGAWTGSWTLAEEFENWTALAFLETSESFEAFANFSTMTFHTSEFRGDLMHAGHSYAYSFLTASSHGDTWDLINITELDLNYASDAGAEVVLSQPFVADAPPTLGVVDVFPISGSAISTCFSVFTTGWIDEDDELTYAFYSFPLPSRDGLTTDGVGGLSADGSFEFRMPEVDWTDYSSPSYFTKKGGRQLRSWSKANYAADLVMPAGAYFLVARARDIHGAVGSAWAIGPVVSEPVGGLSGEAVTGLLNSAYTSGDASKIMDVAASLVSVQSIGTDSGLNVEEMSNSVLTALEAATLVMEVSPDSVQQLANVLSSAVQLGGGAATNLSRAANVLDSCLETVASSDSGIDKAVGDSLMESVFFINKGIGAGQNLSAMTVEERQEALMKRRTLIEEVQQLSTKVGNLVASTLALGASREIGFAAADGATANMRVTSGDPSEGLRTGFVAAGFKLPASLLQRKLDVDKRASRRLQSRKKNNKPVPKSVVETCPSFGLLRTRWVKGNPYSWASPSLDYNMHVARDASVTVLDVQACGTSVSFPEPDPDEGQKSFDFENMSLVVDIPLKPNPPAGFDFAPHCAVWNASTRSWVEAQYQQPVYWDDIFITCLTNIAGTYTAFWVPFELATTSTPKPYEMIEYTTYDFIPPGSLIPTCNYSNMPALDEGFVWNCSGSAPGRGEICKSPCPDTWGKIIHKIGCFRYRTSATAYTLEWDFISRCPGITTPNVFFLMPDPQVNPVMDNFGVMMGLVIGSIVCLLAALLAFLFMKFNTFEYLIRKGRRRAHELDRSEIPVPELKALDCFEAWADTSAMWPSRPDSPVWDLSSSHHSSGKASRVTSATRSRPISGLSRPLAALPVALPDEADITAEAPGAVAPVLLPGVPQPEEQTAKNPRHVRWPASKE